MIKKIQDVLQRRKWEKFRKEYLRLIEKNPKDTRSRLKLGDLYAKEGRIAESVEQYAASAEIFSEAGFQLKSIALYKQILKVQPESISALRRAAQISYQYGLYVDSYPYYENLAKILRSQEGQETLWDIFQEITRLPMKETKLKIQVFESMFPKPGASFTDPYNALCEIAKKMDREEQRDDALTLARWIAGYYPDRQEGLEFLVSVLHKTGQQAELEQALGKLESLYKKSNQLDAKKDFLVQYQAAATGAGPSSDTFDERPSPGAELSADQVKIKMEANIYDLLKKKAMEQKQTPEDVSSDAAQRGQEKSALDRLEFDDLFESFKQGIQGQIAKDDSETHYNLGVAYQEMELFEDAIEEFKTSCENPALQHDAFFMMGNCAKELDKVDDALEYYEKALSIGGLGPEQTCAIRYEQAVTLRAAGRKKEALEVFQDISKKSSNYRDIQQQIEELL